jgi:alkylation response protein AidB-like acyl-CoA dehydrogenase
MALALTEEHLALADSVRGWAARAAPPETVRQGAVDGDAADLYRGTLRPGLAGQGLLGLHLPEALGGQGFGLAELAVAVEETGRALLPGEYLPTVLASTLIAGALATAGPAGGGDGAGAPVTGDTGTAAVDTGLLESLVKGLATGSLTGAVALSPGIGATAGAGGLVIDGACEVVAGAGLADVLVLPAGPDGDPAWVVVDAADAEITPLDSFDLTRPAARVSVHGLRVPPGRVLAGLPDDLVKAAAAALLGAEACGIAAWAVRTAAQYAKVRHQFGRPIGQFQGVKHRCARMLAQAEQAEAAVWDAVRAAGDAELPGPQRRFAAAVAAALAPDAAVTCASECIQVLGGIGYTWEHDAHLYYRRALSLRALLGESGHWAAEATRLALAGDRRPVSVELPEQAEPVREQVRTELAAIAAAEHAEHARLLADGGWVTPHLPRPWGREASPLEQLVIEQERRAAGLRMPGLGIGAWVVPALVQYGTAAQQERFLPATLRGETVWCQLFSEPGAGSDLAGLATRAQRAGGGWKLTGQKVWTSLAKHASWAICVARTDPGAPRHDGITYFLVDMSSPGITVRPLKELTGDSLFNEVFLDGVFVPDDQVVGEVNDGWRVARTTLANERVSLSQSWTFGCGVTELVQAVGGLAGGPSPAVAQRAGRLVCEGHAIDLMGVRATMKRLSGTEPGATGSVRKLLSMRHAQQVAEECWSLTGPLGAVSGGQWSRAVLFTRALTIGGGTTDIQLNIIGERILGLPRDPAPGS